MITENIIKKTQTFLQNNEIADSFRYIKSLDTIELTGVSSNGKERVIIDEVIDEYGEEIVTNDTGFNYLYPCISEGVIKSRTIAGVIYYTHFRVINNTEEHFGLEIKEYHFTGEDFYLRYIITINGLCKKTNEALDDKTDVSYSCVKQFLLNSFTKGELETYFNNDEYKWLLKTAEQDDRNLTHNVKTIIGYVITTFQTINFLSSYNSNSLTEKNKNSAIVINNPDNYINNYSTRNIDINKYYVFKIANEHKEQSAEKSKKIVRRTEKWLVKGHVRKYKNGNIVFIEPYYKGPNKTSESKPKTTYKVIGTLD